MIERLGVRLGPLCLAAALALPTHAQVPLADFEVGEASYSQLLQQRTQQGYRPASITARDTSAGAVFQAVWVPAGSSLWLTWHGLSEPGLRQALTTMRSRSMRPVSIDSYGIAPNERYVAVAVHDPRATWVERHRMSGAAYQNEFNTQASNGYRPYWIGLSGTSTSNEAYNALWILERDGFVGVHGRTLGNFAAELAHWDGRCMQLLAATSHEATTTPLTAAAWGAPRGERFLYSHGDSLSALQSRRVSLAIQGIYPAMVDAYETTAGPRFTASWSSFRQARTFRIVGDRDPATAGFDDVIRDYMQDHDVSQASLAVTRNGSLVVARGYTWDDPTHPDVRPTTPFRIASLSKPIASVAVLQLAEAGFLQLDQPIGNLLNLSGWRDPRIQQVTVRHLLHHWGGWDRGMSPDPLFLDTAIANALGRPLPTDPEMVVDYMRTQPLDFSPGARHAYSNFGYLLLGQIVEAVTGLDHEEYVQRHVFAPLGAAAIRMGRSALTDQLPGEARYEFPCMVPSVLGPNGPSRVEEPYGGFNQLTLDSAGGLVATATDYARFLDAFNQPMASPLLRAQSITEMWRRAPWDTATGPVYYGAGWLVRDLGNGSRNTWHDGSLPGTFTFAVRRADGLNWVVMFNRRHGQSYDIDGLLHTAANAVAQWPTYDLYDQQPTIRTYGSGCGSARWTPHLRGTRGVPPVVGGRLALDLVSLPATATQAFLLFGTSDSSWQGGALPLDLAPLGAAGCSMLASSELVIALPARTGQARVDLPVPMTPTLLGSRLFCQGFVGDPSANRAGIATTPGVEVLLGRH